MPRRARTPNAPLSLFSFQDIMACLTGVLILVVLVLAMDGLSNEMRMASAHAAPAAVAATLEEARAQAAHLRTEVENLHRELAARQAGSAVTEAEVAVLEARAKQAADEIERMRARARAMSDEASRAAAEREAAAAERALLDARRVQAEVALRRERVRFRPGSADGRAPFFVEVSAAGVRLGELNDQQAPVLTSVLHPAATVPQVVRAIAERPPAEYYAVFVVHADGIARFEALRDAVFRQGYEAGWQVWGAEAGPFLEPAP